jgi:hypothetical protein
LFGLSNSTPSAPTDDERFIAAIGREDGIPVDDEDFIAAIKKEQGLDKDESDYEG